MTICRFDSIRIRIVAAYSIRDSIRTEISDSQVSNIRLYMVNAHCIKTTHNHMWQVKGQGHRSPKIWRPGGGITLSLSVWNSSRIAHINGWCFNNITIYKAHNVRKNWIWGEKTESEYVCRMMLCKSWWSIKTSVSGWFSLHLYFPLSAHVGWCGPC